MSKIHGQREHVFEQGEAGRSSSNISGTTPTTTRKPPHPPHTQGTPAMRIAETVAAGPAVLACNPKLEAWVLNVTVLPLVDTTCAFQMFVMVTGTLHVHVICLKAAPLPRLTLDTKPPGQELLTL
jgi:hypothetical protein